MRGVPALWGDFTAAALAISSSIHWSSQAGPGLSGSPPLRTLKTPSADWEFLNEISGHFPLTAHML